MKPSLPKGTRDFGQEEVIKRKYIFDTMRDVFTKYGYLPIETPTMENLTTLTGKYGDEGDKLLFKVLNNGDYLKKADKQALDDLDSKKLTPSISKRGLRYDLTVPFARYVVMNQHKIQFPFKRYQIQPVWRADRPQKGRYQEFYQCDVDVVGSDSLMCEAELITIYTEVFEKLGIGVKILINNRKILYGIAEQVDIIDRFMDMTIAIDKLDKIGVEGVKNELANRGINSDTIDRIFYILNIKTLDELEVAFKDSETGRQGIQELKALHMYLDENQIESAVFDITLARGLGYYTGCIFEVKVDTIRHPKIKMGSIGGGGRYDNLTGTFGLQGVSGVGVSFGAARIYDVMNELHLYPDGLKANPDLLMLSFSQENHVYAYRIASILRKSDISVEVYPDFGKFKKQMKYANNKGMTLVGIIGDDEMQSHSITIKNLDTGDQTKMSIDEVIHLLK